MLVELGSCGVSEDNARRTQRGGSQARADDSVANRAGGLIAGARDNRGAGS